MTLVAHPAGGQGSIPVKRLAGVLLVLLSCGRPPRVCGCVDAANACQPGTSAAACGVAGNACVACPTGQICFNQACTGSPPACTGAAVPDEGQQHVAQGTTVNYGHNPPASGPHWPCWAPYAVATTVVPREQWVHNLEHGGVVLLFRCADASSCPSAQSALAAIDNQAPDAPTGGHRILVTADPTLPTAFAAVAWDFVLAQDTLDAGAMQCFISAREGRGPEDVPSGGSCP